MKKIIFSMVIFVCSLCANAQGLGSYDSDAKRYGRGFDHAVSLFLQDGWGIGYDLRYNFNEYVALDVAGVNMHSRFDSPDDWCQLNIRIGGLRCYTPNWNMIRAYTNFDLGYTMIHAYGEDETHHFGFDFGVGIQVHKSITFGYNLNCVAENNVGNTGSITMSHWARIGFVF